MRVLHVLCDLSGGGAERLVLELCRRRGPGFEAEVAVVQDGGPLGPAFAVAGVAVHRARRSRGRVGLRALGRLTRFAGSFDVVHTHLWAGDVWGRPAGWLAGVPVVSTEHNLDVDEPPWKTAVKRASGAIPRRIVAVSDAVASHLWRLGVPRSRIEVIHNGVDPARFAAPWTGGEGVLAVGRLVPQKGFDVLIAAARRLGHVRFAIAGEGPLREALEASAPANVRFLGRVEDIAERMARADVVVVPSRWEGFGLAAAEALAAGAPLVASRVDGLVEVVGDAGVLVPADDPDALTLALGSLLADPVRRQALSRAGRARARLFDLERTVRRYERMYQTLV